METPAPETQHEPANTGVRIVGLCGSLRPRSYTRMAVEVALRGAREVGADTQMLDLRAYDLGFFDGKQSESANRPGVFRLRQDLRDAQGVVLGTPEYHGSFSGVLKNALDFMGFDEFEGKMIGLVGVSAGRMGGIDALTSLRTIGRALHAWVVPEQVAVPEVWKAFDETGNPREPEMEQRLMEVGRQVARFSYLHSSEHVREFLRLWEEAQPNPGGTD